MLIAERVTNNIFSHFSLPRGRVHGRRHEADGLHGRDRERRHRLPDGVRRVGLHRTCGCGGNTHQMEIVKIHDFSWKNNEKSFTTPQLEGFMGNLVCISSTPLPPSYVQAYRCAAVGRTKGLTNLPAGQETR